MHSPVCRWAIETGKLRLNEVSYITQSHHCLQLLSYVNRIKKTEKAKKNRFLDLFSAIFFPLFFSWYCRFLDLFPTFFYNFLTVLGLDLDSPSCAPGLIFVLKWLKVLTCCCAGCFRRSIHWNLGKLNYTKCNWNKTKFQIEKFNFYCRLKTI